MEVCYYCQESTARKLALQTVNVQYNPDPFGYTTFNPQPQVIVSGKGHVAPDDFFRQRKNLV